MAKVVMYTKDACPYCNMAKDLLNSKNVAFEEIRADLDEQAMQDMIRLSNRRTMPQIFINDQSIGGYDDLAALERAGKLDELLNA